MIEVTTTQQIYLCFAHLLDYPNSDLLPQARQCVGILEQDFPQAAEQIQGFVGYMENTQIGRLEEIYTGTFDVSPACFIFAGYILFGESFDRGKFLVRLQKEYRERDFSAGNELADHLAVMFRFMTLLDPNEHLAQLLVGDCFIPVLTKMDAGFTSKDGEPNPYQQVLKAILTVIEQTQKSVVM